MAKRFYDTSRIEEDWYIELSCKHRELLRYCESKCDGAGIFSFNAKIASTYIGEKILDIDLEMLPVSKLPNGKYFLVGFCKFQNGELSRTSPSHKPIFKSIEQNGITESVLFDTLFNTLSNRVQEKEIVIEKEKEEEIDYKVLLENVKAKMIDDYILCETVCKNRGFSKGQYDFAVSDFLGTLPEPELEKEYSEIGRHFGNWCRNNERTILSKQIKPAKTAAKDDDWY